MFLLRMLLQILMVNDRSIIVANYFVSSTIFNGRSINNVMISSLHDDYVTKILSLFIVSKERL